jgi:hypothetical protein
MDQGGKCPCGVYEDIYHHNGEVSRNRCFWAARGGKRPCCDFRNSKITKDTFLGIEIYDHRPGRRTYLVYFPRLKKHKSGTNKKNNDIVICYIASSCIHYLSLSCIFLQLPCYQGIVNCLVCDSRTTAFPHCCTQAFEQAIMQECKDVQMCNVV